MEILLTKIIFIYTLTIKIFEYQKILEVIQYGKTNRNSKSSDGRNI